jgi:TetR/AcrR family transcriptional regulator, cholesterol catabolism regulator
MASMGNKRKTRKTGPAPNNGAALARPNRRQLLIDEAARLFGRDGFAGTSTREIAAAVGMLPGSLYYHFKSKEELALAVHEYRVMTVRARVQEAVDEAGSKAWDRLEAACIAHIECLLDGSGYPAIVTPQFATSLPPAIRTRFIEQRRTYELIFRGLIEDLPLSKSIDRRYFRLALFGSINWTLSWYRPGGDTPTVVARRIFAVFRGSHERRS